MSLAPAHRVRFPLSHDIGFAFVSVLFSVLHLCQAIVFSGFAKMPGDLGDGRFNNLVLEHVYRSWKGIYPLWSPGQFYPVQGTLTFSDNHLGTAFIYALFRLVGCDIENAFQAWILVICALNALSFYLLLRELNVSPWLCVPCVFFGTSSCALIIQFGHPQILPFFPFILTLFFLLRAWGRRDLTYVVPAIIFYTYQHFCYVYDGYFSTWIILLLVLVWAMLNASSLSWRQALGRPQRRQLTLIALTCALSVVALSWLYYSYYSFSRTGSPRSLSDVVRNFPRWSSWFSASPFSLLYHSQNFLPPSSEINLVENFLFPGWIIWILGLASVPFLWVTRTHCRTDPTWQIVACILFAWLVVLLGVTIWSVACGSPYLFLCRMVPAIRAFRCVSRIAILLGLLQAILAALLLQAFSCSTIRPLRLVALLIAGVLPLDTFSVGEVSCSRQIARDRAIAVLHEWRKVQTSKPLLFVPNPTNQDAYAINLDAWSAALRCDGRTINGYSGNQPLLPGFAAFLDEPTPAKGRALLKNLKLPESSVAVVTTWEPAFMQTAGIVRVEVAPSIAPRTSVKSLTCSPSAEIILPVTIHYQGDTPVTLGDHNVFLSYRIYCGSTQIGEGPRTTVPPLSADQTMTLNMRLLTPGSSGQYTVHLSMVYEGLAWWEDKGWGGDLVQLAVR
jgi:hypothetical protein